MRWTAKRSRFSLRGSESSPVCQSIPAPSPPPPRRRGRSRVYSVRPSSLTPLPAFLTHFDADQRGEERAAKKEKRKKAKDERGRKGRRKGRVLIKRGKGPKGAKGERRAGWSSSCCLSLGHGDTLSLSAFLVPPDERLVQAGHECRRGGRACRRRRRGHGRPLRLQRPLRQRLYPLKNGADDGHRRRFDRCVLRQSFHSLLPFAMALHPALTPLPQTCRFERFERGGLGRRGVVPAHPSALRRRGQARRGQLETGSRPQLHREDCG